MNFVIGEHSSIYLFAEPMCLSAHCIKMILEEKEVSYQYEVAVEDRAFSQNFDVINPENKLPFFMERDLYLSELLIICEYLDERFPHPPLMPVEPAMRSLYRAAIKHVDERFYAVYTRTQSINKKTIKNARKELEDNILEYAESFRIKKYFMNDELGLLDCMLAPLLWRLKKININIKHKSILEYQETIFKYPSFRSSMSEEEADLDIE